MDNCQRWQSWTAVSLTLKHWRFVGWLSGIYFAVALATVAIEYVKAKFRGLRIPEEADQHSGKRSRFRSEADQ